MKGRLASTLGIRAAAVAILVVGCEARAKSVISMQFIPCPITCSVCPPPNMCDPCWTTWTATAIASNQDAGVDAINWNILTDSAGTFFKGLVRDDDGVSTGTNAGVVWGSTNISSNPPEVLNFEGIDRGDKKLMTFYLDQNTSFPSTTFIQITGIPDDFAAYDVVVYTLTNVVNLAGGVYEVTTDTGAQTKYVLTGGNAFFGGPNFVQAIGDDPAFGRNDWGNYVRFTGLSGSSVYITATNESGGKAPVNGVQIVKTLPP